MNCKKPFLQSDLSHHLLWWVKVCGLHFPFVINALASAQSDRLKFHYFLWSMHVLPQVFLLQHKSMNLSENKLCVCDCMTLWVLCIMQHRFYSYPIIHVSTWLSQKSFKSKTEGQIKPDIFNLVRAKNRLPPKTTSHRLSGSKNSTINSKVSQV